MYKPDRSWTVGFQVCNPIPVSLSDDPGDQVPVVFRIGVGYDIQGKALILLEGEKDLEHKPVIRTGVEVRLARSFLARVGVLTDPFMVTGGIGFELGKFDLDIATGYHMVLGFSPSISIGFSISKSK